MLYLYNAKLIENAAVPFNRRAENFYFLCPLRKSSLLHLQNLLLNMDPGLKPGVIRVAERLGIAGTDE